MYTTGLYRGRYLLASVHLVALTGYGHEEANPRTRGVGLDRHLTKPVVLPELEVHLAGLPS